jgi:hypothetical protein
MDFAKDYRERVRAERKRYRLVDGMRRWRRISTPQRMAWYAGYRQHRMGAQRSGMGLHYVIPQQWGVTL